MTPEQRNALTIAGITFCKYAQHHLDKNDLDKALKNIDLAEVMETALNQPAANAYKHVVRDGQVIISVVNTGEVTNESNGSNLYWSLHTLSKCLESNGIIDERRQPDAYSTILDAMNYVRNGK